MLSHDLIPPHINFSHLTTSDYAEMYGVIKTVKEDGFAQLGLEPCLLEDELNKVRPTLPPVATPNLPLSLTRFNLCARLSAGGPGNRLGLHRLHWSHDPFPRIALLVRHVLLHADQPGTGKYDRHHDRHYHTCAGYLQDPEGDFNRWTPPPAPLTQNCSYFKQLVGLQSCSIVTYY